jgi:hypothetical protein
MRAQLQREVTHWDTLRQFNKTAAVLALLRNTNALHCAVVVAVAVISTGYCCCYSLV